MLTKTINLKVKVLKEIIFFVNFDFLKYKISVEKSIKKIWFRYYVVKEIIRNQIKEIRGYFKDLRFWHIRFLELL